MNLLCNMCFNKCNFYHVVNCNPRYWSHFIKETQDTICLNALVVVTFEHMYQNQFTCGLSFLSDFQWENVFCSPENQKCLSYSTTERGQLANSKNLSQHTLLYLDLSRHNLVPKSKGWKNLVKTGKKNTQQTDIYWYRNIDTLFYIPRPYFSM